MCSDFERKKGLCSASGPAGAVTNGREGMAVKGRGTMLAESLKMVARGVTLVAREAILRIDGVPFFHAGVAVGLGEDGGCGDGDAASIAFDEGFLLDEDIKLHGVDEKIVRYDTELLKRGGHGLAAGLINVPGVDALGIHFGDGPGEGVFANALGELHAAAGG